MAVKYKGGIFEILYQLYVPRMGKPIGVIAHRLCRLIRKILHQGVHYEEGGWRSAHGRTNCAHGKNDPAIANSQLQG